MGKTEAKQEKSKRQAKKEKQPLVVKPESKNPLPRPFRERLLAHREPILETPSDDDEELSDEEFWRPDKDYYVLEKSYNAILAAKKEFEEISARKYKDVVIDIDAAEKNDASNKEKKFRRLRLMKSHNCPRMQWMNGDLCGPVREEECVICSVTCGICLEKGDHIKICCPYRHHVPKGAKLGPGGRVICKCCGQAGGHPGRDDWVGEAVLVRVPVVGVK